MLEIAESHMAAVDTELKLAIVIHAQGAGRVLDAGDDNVVLANHHLALVVVVAIDANAESSGGAFRGKNVTLVILGPVQLRVVLGANVETWGC